MQDPFPLLKSERLLLRQITPGDLDNIFEGLSHPDVIRYYGVSYQSREATHEQMKFFADLEANKTGIWWAVCNVPGNKFYGAGGLNNLHAGFRKAEIGFWLLPSYWGSGLMKEGLELICRYAFEKLNLHRIEALVETGNEHCRQAMKKTHFVHEGTMRDCEIKNGRYISLDIYARLNEIT
jgi:ribosomal-protein-alanine N-acetyltransferase